MEMNNPHLIYIFTTLISVNGIKHLPKNSAFEPYIVSSFLSYPCKMLDQKKMKRQLCERKCKERNQGDRSGLTSSRYVTAILIRKQLAKMCLK